MSQKDNSRAQKQTLEKRNLEIRGQPGRRRSTPTNELATEEYRRAKENREEKVPEQTKVFYVEGGKL